MSVANLPTLSSIKAKLPVLQTIKSREDKYLKKPEQRKYSVENYKQKADFYLRDKKAKEDARNCGRYDRDQIIMYQLSSDYYLKGKEHSAREIEK